MRCSSHQAKTVDETGIMAASPFYTLSLSQTAFFSHSFSLSIARSHARPLLCLPKLPNQAKWFARSRQRITLRRPSHTFLPLLHTHTHTSTSRLIFPWKAAAMIHTTLSLASVFFLPLHFLLRTLMVVSILPRASVRYFELENYQCTHRLVECREGRNNKS